MRGAVFDIDGTVLDSMTIWYDLTVRFFKRNNVKISDEENLYYQSMTFEETLPLIQEKHLPHLTFEGMLAELKALAEYAYRYEIPPKDGACEYIKKLHDDGIKIAVATSGFSELCRAALERIGILHCIDAFAFSAETGCSKGEPDIYLLAAKRLGLSPSECEVYEDLITGIKSAKSAGFSTTAIYDSTNEHLTKELKESADRYITTWNELF